MKKKEIFFIVIGFLLTFSCFQHIYRPELKGSGIVLEDKVLDVSSDEELPSFGWKQNWAGPHWDIGIKMAIDSSDNIHITGYSEQDLNNDEDFLYLKYDGNGVLLDSITWDRNNEANIGRDIILDSSNNYYIGGYTDVDPDVWVSDYNTYIRKVSSAGVPQWEHIWGGSESDIARTIALDSFGNVYLGGLTRSYGAGQADMLLMKYSNAGTLQWNKTYGGIESEWTNSMKIDSSDNIYLAGGFRYNDSTDYDTYLVKVDSNGIEQWTRVWGGVGDELGISIALDSSENVYIVGDTTSFGAGYNDLFMLKYDSYGNLIWNITYGTNNYESGWPITIDWQDSIYVGGELYDVQTSESSIFVAKFTQNGNQLWNMTYDISETSEYLYDMKISSAGDIYLTGGEYFSGTTYMDVYIMKFNYELSEFVIISPEDKTYTGPMSGYYPATYGFEIDVDGSDPTEWIILNEDPDAEVISELDGHKKVLRLYDIVSGSGRSTRVYNNFTKKDYGTIETWIQQNDLGSTDERGQITGMGNGSSLFGVRMYGGSPAKWVIRNNGSNIDIIGAPTPSINTWYHIRIDFEHTTGGYQGLSQNEYFVYIDGVRYGPYLFDADEQLDELDLHTYSYGSGYSVYFDAVGYSWAPNYNIGDNLNEGLLLDFKSKNLLEWKAYSLDDQSNVSIIGRTVIPLPDDGSHIIQVFGNDSLGKIYETEKRSFVVDTRIPEITILSPLENKVYGKLAPKYNLFIDEENLISAWYTIDGGITNFTITELNDYIDQDAWLAASDGQIFIEFYAKDIVGHIGYKNTTIIKNVINPLTIEMIDFFFSTEVFNLTFYICNETGDGIDFADVQIWWDEIEVSSDVQNLGDGLYFISLDPITVVPGEDPIILQISAYATGYDGKYFETAISVDPDTLQKDILEDQQIDGIPIEIIIISISLSSAAVLGVGIYILMRRRKKLQELR